MTALPGFRNPGEPEVQPLGEAVQTPAEGQDLREDLVLLLHELLEGDPAPRGRVGAVLEAEVEEPRAPQDRADFLEAADHRVDRGTIPLRQTLEELRGLAREQPLVLDQSEVRYDERHLGLLG